jgi:hypothetical protein
MPHDAHALPIYHELLDDNASAIADTVAEIQYHNESCDPRQHQLMFFHEVSRIYAPATNMNMNMSFNRAAET